MTQGGYEEYEARQEENFDALPNAETREERRAIEDLIEEDFAAHFRLSNEARQVLHEAAVIRRWMLKWAWPLIVFLFVFPAGLDDCFHREAAGVGMDGLGAGSRFRRDLGGLPHRLVAGVTRTLTR